VRASSVDLGLMYALGGTSTPIQIPPNSVIPNPLLQDPFEQPDSARTDKEVTITLSTSSNNQNRWSAYVSYQPVQFGCLWHRTVHAATSDAVRLKAEDLAARWKVEANKAQPTDGAAAETDLPKKRNHRGLSFEHILLTDIT
jgi:hypothetical protein